MVFHQAGGHEMSIDRFFVCKPDQHSGYKSFLMDDDDVLPLDTFINALPIYSDNEKVILRVRLDMPTIVELQNQTECADPLSLEAVEALGITKAYIGPTIESVFEKYPELEGQRQSGVDDEGNPVMVDIVSRGTWA